MNTEVSETGTAALMQHPEIGLTMSSVDIAALTGKQHKNVARDIRTMLSKLGEDVLKFEHIFYDSYGREMPSFLLPKRETLILVSGYSVELRARIVDRWLALEAAIAAPTAVTDISGEVRKVMGGIVKGIIHKELGEVMPSMVQAVLSERNYSLRSGRTAGVIWLENGLPKLKNASLWLGNRLEEMGCCIQDNGRGELGLTCARLFDPDKVRICMKNGLLEKAKAYVAERYGQGKLRLVSASGAKV